MALEFRQLEVFCEVVRLGSFSRAAVKVGLSQTSVSERIALLEEQVGARLLDRSRRRGVHTTPIGQVLYERAVQLLEDRERAEHEIRDMLGLRQGTLRVGASTVPGTYHLPAVIRQFTERYPDTRFAVSIAASEQVVDWVASGRVEIGIAGDPGKHMVDHLFRGGRSGLRREGTLWQDQLVLAVPPGHPFARRARVSVAELAGVPFVMRESGSGTRRWLELHLEDQLPGGVPVAAEMGSPGAVVQAVIEGLGIALVSARSVAVEREAGLLCTVELEGAALNRHFYLIRDEQRTPSPLCRLFSHFLLEQCGAAVAVED